MKNRYYGFRGRGAIFGAFTLAPLINRYGS
jgi:hypothetical protein